jgi:hypothetical protein
MGNNSSGGGGGITLGSAIFLIFLTLKLLGIEPVASWSWWWVTSPLWIGFAIFIGIIAFGTGSIGIIALLGKLFAGRTPKLDDDDD